MQNPITKAVRYLRREYPFMTTGALAGTAIGAFAATIACAASGGMFFMIPVLALAMGGGMTLLSLPMGGEHNRPEGNTETVNGVKLVGEPRDIASISMTQRLISDYTKKQQHLPELPARTMRKIAAHILDIQEALARVRAYADPSGEKQTVFSFKREMLNEKGKKIEVPVVTCTLPLSALPLPAPQAPAILSASALSGLQGPKADFASAVAAPAEKPGNNAPVTAPDMKI